MKRYLLLALIIPLLSHGDVNAATIFGRVIEVSSGDTITIFNLNRPVRIRLLGIDAPELDQAFGDVARKHLHDLVYDKSVLVDYSGIAADSSLTGRVLLNNADIGAQMVRDGAAWADPNNQDRLSATDQEVYRLSQEAARRERRGLWQAENPTSPWDFVKAMERKQNPYGSLVLEFPEPKSRTPRATPEFNNLSLIGPRETSNATLVEFDPRMSWDRSAGSNWFRFRPTGEMFSVLVPANGEEKSTPGEEDPSSVYRGYMAKDGWSRYAIQWVTLPSRGENDQAAIASILKHFLEGFGHAYKQTGARRGLNLGFSCEPEDQRDVSMNGFVGSEFDLKSCTVPGKARIFTRLNRERRQVYLAFAFYLEEDPNVKRFINSFVISGAGSKGR